MNAFVVGTGHATPSRLVDNAEIESALGLESGWIERRTGVRRRRLCGPDESCSTLAVDAGRAALADARIDAAEIGLVLLATSTPDYLLPPTAPAVATTLGCEGAGAIDLAGACSGFLYALSLGSAWAGANAAKVLVIAANVLSRRLDPTDAGGRAVFADGAGAVVLSTESTPGAGTLRGLFLSSDGTHANAIRVRAGGSVIPMSADAVAEGLHYLRIENGSIVFQEAVRGMTRASLASLSAAGLSTDDVDVWIPHQANSRILERVRAQLGIDRDRCHWTLSEWGNSSAASLPTALSLERGAADRSKPKIVLMSAIGAGMVEAAGVIHWSAMESSTPETRTS